MCFTYTQDHSVLRSCVCSHIRNLFLASGRSLLYTDGSSIVSHVLRGLTQVNHNGGGDSFVVIGLTIANFCLA